MERSFALLDRKRWTCWLSPAELGLLTEVCKIFNKAFDRFCRYSSWPVVEGRTISAVQALLNTDMEPEVNSFLQAAKRPRLKMPWEVGFAALVLDTGPSSAFASSSALLRPVWDNSFLRQSTADEPEETQKEVAGNLKVPVMKVDDVKPFRGRMFAPLPWPLVVEAARQAALDKWN